MDKALYKKFCNLVYDNAGIQLKEGKEALVTARISKRIRALDLDSPREYFDYLQTDQTSEEIVSFLDAISTNFTSFYRESVHFDLLERELKGLVEAGQKKIRCWSAASSSGEEPYTIACTAMEAFKGEKVDFKILATDISTKVLSAASEGIYDTERVEPIPRNIRTKYFKRIGRRDSEEERFQVKPELREKIAFKRLNLSKPPFPMKGPMDVVFCRNVMIYFPQDVRQGLISEIERLLKPGGLLCIAHSETLNGIDTGLKFIETSVFRKVE